MSEKTERLNIRVFQSEKKGLRRLAEIEGEAMSVVIRRILRNELHRHGLLDRELHEGENQTTLN